MKPTIILISGKAGTGKSTAARILAHMFGGVLLHFANGVKEAAVVSFGWDKEKDEKGRELLQRIGQAGRSYNENLWVNQAAEIILKGVYNPYIIDDWRFPNELHRIQEIFSKHHIVTIRMEAPKREILKGLPAYNEVSENSLDGFKFNHRIYNGGSMEVLKTTLSFLEIE